MNGLYGLPASRTFGRLAALAAIAALGGVVLVLAGVAIDRTPTAAAGAANLGHLGGLWIASAVAWVALTALAAHAMTAGADARPSAGRAAAGILLVAAAARVVVVFTHAPSLSDDLHRYVFDGRNLAAGVNPYLLTPEARAAEIAAGAAEHWPGEADLLPRINNGELHTIYLPLSQWVFGAAGAAVPDTASAPGASGRVFRLVFVALDLGLIGLILLALRRRGRSATWAALYAWHPLPVIEIAGSGHQDGLGVLLLVGALLLFTIRPKRVVPWTIVLAGSALIKPFVLPVAPLLLRGRCPRAWAISAGVGALVVGALAAPLWLAEGGAPFANVTATAQRFSLKWAHFGSVYEPALWAIEQATNDPDDAWRLPERDDLWTNDDQERLARGLCVGLVALVCLAVFLSRLDAWAGARVILLAMVLLSSTAHPWYLLWALALVPVAPGAATWVASLTLPWGYAQLGDVMEWTTPTWVMIAAYAPVYAAVVVAILRYRRRSRAPGPDDGDGPDPDETRNEVT